MAWGVVVIATFIITVETPVVRVVVISISKSVYTYVYIVVNISVDIGFIFTTFIAFVTFFVELMSLILAFDPCSLIVSSGMRSVVKLSWALKTVLEFSLKL